MKTDALVLLLIFYWNISYYFWIIVWLKKVHNFQMAKVQNLKWQNLRLFLSIRLIFCQFQSGVANENVAYKKACIY